MASDSLIHQIQKVLYLIKAGKFPTLISLGKFLFIKVEDFNNLLAAQSLIKHIQRVLRPDLNKAGIFPTLIYLGESIFTKVKGCNAFTASNSLIKQIPRILGLILYVVGTF